MEMEFDKQELIKQTIEEIKEDGVVLTVALKNITPEDFKRALDPENDGEEFTNDIISSFEGNSNRMTEAMLVKVLRQVEEFFLGRPGVKEAVKILDMVTRSGGVQTLDLGKEKK